GFTGGTGGLTVVQDVRTWFYHTEGSSRPAAPTNLVADPYSNPGIVHLNWRYSSAHEDGFQIERSDDGGQTYHKIGTVGPQATTFDDAPDAGTYFYRVRAFNAFGFSTYATTGPVAVLVPDQPRDLAVINFNPAQVTLQWFEPNILNVDGFRIE